MGDSEYRENVALNKYGEPMHFDPTFKGPLKGRSCTDIICLLFFILFLVVWGGISWYAFTDGDINRLVVPTDSMGRKCGVDKGLEKRKKLFFFDLTKCATIDTAITGCGTPQVCVEDCPSEFFFMDTYTGSIEELRPKLICVDDFNKNTIKTLDEAKKITTEKFPKCARYYMKSGTFSSRCIPNDEENLKKVIAELDDVNEEIIGQAFKNLGLQSFTSIAQIVVLDIQNAYLEIILGLLFAMLICLIFIFVMRWIAAPIVWLSLFGSIALLSFSVYYSATEYKHLKDAPKETNNGIPLNIDSFIKQQLGRSETWLILLIILSILLGIILLVVLFLRKRIVIAIALIKEGSKAVSSITASVFFPIFPWILQLIVIAFAIAVGLYLASVGTMSYKMTDLSDDCPCKGKLGLSNDSVCNPVDFAKCKSEDTTGFCALATCNFKGIDNPHIITYMQVYNIFGFFWALFFISAFGQMVLASTFATWYWTFHKSEVPFFTVLGGMGRTVRYHLGTLAFGSLIIAICRMIRLIIEYIDRKIKKYDNEVTKAILCCCKCFFWCLEKFLKFINKNAYIMCAIHGKNFCGSAKDAFNLLMRNFLRVIALDKVTDFLFFLSKILIALLMGGATYSWYEYGFAKEEVNYKLVPMAMVGIGSYLIATIFFNVYSMAVDTLFLCFLEDCERNDGSEEKPYFMSKQLMKVLGKKNILHKNDYSRGE